jgi:hypothetical protein
VKILEFQSFPKTAAVKAECHIRPIPDQNALGRHEVDQDLRRPSHAIAREQQTDDRGVAPQQLIPKLGDWLDIDRLLGVLRLDQGDQRPKPY